MLRASMLLVVLSVLTPMPSRCDEESVAAVLDALHDAAAKAEAERYWSLFAEDAIFFGTDPAERWTIEQFHAYADPYFEQGRGWTYRVASRHVFLNPGGGIAWFDEELTNETYGACRGTGVLVEVDGEWKIAQYNLSLPIPNDLATTVVEMIRASQ